ncbi:tyrosine-type recombinase/integrase [Shewanella sp. Koi 1]
MKLYDKNIRAVFNKNHPKAFELSDGRGLGARVSPLGKVRWQYRYKIDGKNFRMDLGDYPELSLVKARDMAHQCREWLANGKDPKIQRSIGREKSFNPITVKDALEYWYAEQAVTRRKNHEKHRAQFVKHIYPYIGHLPITDLETRHWIECFDRISKGIPSKQRPAPVASGYVLQNIKQALIFCKNRQFVHTTALDSLTIQDVGRKQNKRDRVLSQRELADFIKLLNSDVLPEYYGNLFKLLVIFGARTHEVRESTWSQWDFEEGLWTVHSRENKNKMVKIVRPIPDDLKEFMVKLKGNAKSSDLILGKFKEDATVSAYGGSLWKKLGHSEKWTLHDLRRVISTYMNDLGVAPYVVEQLLGHKLGGVMAIYNRSQYIPEKKKALDMWVERLKLLVDKPDNVSILKRKA